MIARAFYSGKVDAEKKDSDNWYSAEMRVLEAIGIYDLSDSAGEKRTLMEDETVGLSRYQMAVMVANVLGGVEKVKEKDINTATEKVSDAMDDPLYGPYVVRCVSVGLLNGYEDGMFHGENTLTRAQAATVICNLWRGYEYYLEQ